VQVRFLFWAQEIKTVTKGRNYCGPFYIYPSGKQLFILFEIT